MGKNRYLILGLIPQEHLSDVFKTLILIDNDDEHIFYASAGGNNCVKWLLKIAETKDITVKL